jgi:hypothetical protein
MAWTTRLIVGVGFLTVLWLPNGLAKEAAKQPALEDYELIVSLDRNMFAKNRQVPNPIIVVPAQPEPNPESFYILRGIARENGVFLVFLQDIKRGGVLQMRVGEAVARGKIKSVLSLDSIEYQMGETTTTIQMGYDLEGNKSSVGLRESSSQRRPDDAMRGPDTRNGGMQGTRGRQQDSSGPRRNRGTGMTFGSLGVSAVYAGTVWKRQSSQREANGNENETL